MSSHASSATYDILNAWGIPAETTADREKSSRNDIIDLDAGLLKVKIEKEALSSGVTIPSVSYTRYRTLPLLFSSFSLSTGLFDIYMYFFNNTYIFHPYFALALCVGGGSLLATLILAMRGK